MSRRTTVADVAANAGLVEAKVRRQTKRVVSIYLGDEAGLDTCGGEYPFSTVCEDHSQVICHETLSLAKGHAADPMGWCEVCNGADAEAAAEYAAEEAS